MLAYKLGEGEPRSARVYHKQRAEMHLTNKEGVGSGTITEHIHVTRLWMMYRIHQTYFSVRVLIFFSLPSFSLLSMKLTLSVP